LLAPPVRETTNHVEKYQFTHRHTLQPPIRNPPFRFPHRKRQHTLDTRYRGKNTPTLDGTAKIVGEGRPTSQPLHQDTNILNLSSTFHLSPSETRLLERGLTFIPTPLHSDYGDLQRDIYRYHRTLKLLDHFDYTSDYRTLPFTAPSRWEPKSQTISAPIRKLIKTNTHIIRECHTATITSQQNITLEERRAIAELRKHKHITIKPADKGSKIIIMDNQQYLFEAHRQLSNTQHYTPIPASTQIQTQTKIRQIISDLYGKKYITHRQKEYLDGPDQPRQRLFYLLPKIHQTPDTWTVPFKVPKGRPIVSDCGSESSPAAEFIDYFLNPISQRHPSYLKDTYHFIDTLHNLPVPTNAYLFTIDIDSLYTNINIPSGLAAVKSALRRYPDPDRPD
uniref:Reverse transcriptase domain-containing protein n=1 Tax=Hucho hucho TaxID=62062 RepID=A0A4W5LRR3_9TELE